jgi:hypothetical protein
MQEIELKVNAVRRCDERLSDWSKPEAVKVYWNGKLLEPLSVAGRVEL